MNVKKLYQEGFVPGPNESEEAFQNRVISTKELTSDPSPLSIELGLSLEIFNTLSPSFLLLRSNKKLPFYYGGMTWVVELADKTAVTILQLPLKRRFSYISEEEIISHEKIHILRANFKEPLFEEILAYRTAKNLLRRYLGPIIQETYEIAVFFAALALPTLTALFYPALLHLSFIPILSLSIYATVRLALKQRVVTKAIKHLSKSCANPEELAPLLTDAEIISLSKGHMDFLTKEGLRYQLIRELLKRN